VKSRNIEEVTEEMPKQQQSDQVFILTKWMT